MDSKFFIRPKRPTGSAKERAIQSQMPATYVGRRENVLSFRLQNNEIYQINFNPKDASRTDNDGNEMIIRPYAGKLEGKDYIPEEIREIVGNSLVSIGYGDAGLQVLDNTDDPAELRAKQRYVKRTNEEQLIQYLEKHPLVYLSTPNPTISPFLQNKRHFRYLGKRPDSPNIIVFQLADPQDDDLDLYPPIECTYENGILRSTRNGTVVSFRIPVAEEREIGKMGDEEEGSRLIRERRQREDEALSQAPISSRTRSKRQRTSGGKSRRRKHKRRKCKRKSSRKNHY
jgi:hypothetical protein